MPNKLETAKQVVQAFFDLYASERGWKVRAAHKAEMDELQLKLDSDLFPTPNAAEVNHILQERRFVVLQGPPGTGKTRLAEAVREQFFDGRGVTVQFHPAVTYEDFVVGLSPDVGNQDLRFQVRPGWLVEAARAAQEARFLLIIDEINRADLSKVLGEAIYLFEYREVGGERARTVELPHPISPDGRKSFQLPTNLYILATMNTADRSIAGMDLAVRRRFAFITMMPDPKVVQQKGVALAQVQFAPADALNLLPGHSYFLAESKDELQQRFKYELIPLLDEYLQEGLVSSFASELQAVRDAIEDVSDSGIWFDETETGEDEDTES